MDKETGRYPGGIVSLGDLETPLIWSLVIKVCLYQYMH